MKIQFNTDGNIEGAERYSEYFNPIIAEKLSRFDSQITRVEVHLKDEDGGKNGQNDKRCVMETRLEGLKPVAVTNHGNTYELAIKGAIEKTKTALGTLLGKLKEH